MDSTGGVYLCNDVYCPLPCVLILYDPFSTHSYDNVKQSLENRVAQAATQDQQFTGKLPTPEETPSLPNPNKNFLNPQQ